MAIPEAQLLETHARRAADGRQGAGAGAADGRLIPILLTLAGIALVLVAGWVITSASTERPDARRPRRRRAAVARPPEARQHQVRTDVPTRPVGRARSGWRRALLRGLRAVAADRRLAQGRPRPRGRSTCRRRCSWPEPLGRDTNGYSLLVARHLRRPHLAHDRRDRGHRRPRHRHRHRPARRLVRQGSSTPPSASAPTPILAFPPLILHARDRRRLRQQRAHAGPRRSRSSRSRPTRRLMRAQTLVGAPTRVRPRRRGPWAPTNRRLMWREVLPNAILPVISYSFIVIAVVIVAEGSLSYLGVGVPSPQAELGRHDRRRPAQAEDRPAPRVRARRP